MERVGRKNFGGGEAASARGGGGISGRGAGGVGTIRRDRTFGVQLLEIGGRGKIFLYGAGEAFQLRGGRVHAQHSFVGGAGKRDGTDIEDDV